MLFSFTYWKDPLFVADSLILLRCFWISSELDQVTSMSFPFPFPIFLLFHFWISSKLFVVWFSLLFYLDKEIYLSLLDIFLFIWAIFFFAFHLCCLLLRDGRLLFWGMECWGLFVIINLFNAVFYHWENWIDIKFYFLRNNACLFIVGIESSIVSYFLHLLLSNEAFVLRFWQVLILYLFAAGDIWGFEWSNISTK